MIRIVFSNHSEQLLDTLAEDLRDARERRGPWEPLQLVLPSQGVREYVRTGLARTELKVVANLQMNYLEGFWRKTLPAAEPGLRLLDRAAIQGLVLGLLQDAAFLAHPDLEPIRGYLREEPRGMKALQLSGAVARVFEAYLLGRDGWMERWERGGTVGGPGSGDLETWQRRLWLGLKERTGTLPGRWMTLPEYFGDPLFDQGAFPEELFFFGPGPMAQAYHRAFWRLGQRSEDVNATLYAHNPCRELWDDLRKGWGDGQDQDPFGTDTQAHLALQRWGKPGREHTCKLCELVDWNVDMDPVLTGGSSLLHRLQDEILTLGTEPSPGPPSPDASLRVLACPSPRREAECVADEIWETILGGQGAVRFSEIAVILPEGAKDAYLDPLKVAFAQARQIPWRLADEGPTQVRELAEGALLALKLGLTDLSRAEVLRALSHPAFLRRWPGLGLDQLADFCAQAGIVARLDAGETEGTYLEDGLWTWERGIRRAALGLFLGGEGAVEAGGLPLPAAVTQAGGPDFALLLRALLTDARTLRGLRQGPRDWSRTFRTFLHAYLGQPDGQGEEAEHRAMAELVDALARLEALELPGLAPPLLDCREAAALAEESFTRLVKEGLGHFGRGVVVASHAALRGIPFKAVFLMGMGEGVFPGADAKDPLDLRAFERKAGDVSRAEQDRYLFLEALTSARERLVLSYVARDPLTGEELQPSPLVLDLRDILAPALGPEGWRSLVVAHPHHRHDLAYFPDLDGGPGGLCRSHSPAARDEAEALWLGRRLRQAAGGLPQLPGDPATWGLAPNVLKAVRERLRHCGPLGPRDASQLPDRLRIQAGALRKWLECQIQGGAQLRLGLRGEAEDDAAELAEEPFGTAFLDRRSLERAAFWECLATGAPVAKVQARLRRRLREDAKAPAGFLDGGEIRASEEKIQGWLDLLPQGVQPGIRRFGQDRSRGVAALAVTGHDPVELALDLGGRTLTVLLEGATEPQWEGASLLLSDHPPPGPGAAPDPRDRKHLLRAWFDQLLLAAAGLREGPHRAQVLAFSRDGKARPTTRLWQAQLPPVDQAAAIARLGQWLKEALTEPRWTLMPIEGVLECLEQPEPDLEAWLEKAQEGAFTSFSSQFGPLPRAVDAPVEPDWASLAQARYGDFLAWSAGRGEAP